METLPSVKDFKLPVFGKIIRWVIPAALIYFLFKGFNYVAPTIDQALDNFWKIAWKALLIGIPTMVYLMNRTTIKLWWLGWCKKLSSWIIAMDPISVMKGYLVTLKKKAANLAETLLFLSGKKVELERIMSQKQQDYTRYTNLALAAKEQNEPAAAALNMQKALQCKKSVEIYKPIYNRYEMSTTFLSKLQENWKNTIDSLGFTIDIKTEEYQTIKSMTKGLKSIEDLISSDSPEAQAFGESMKALEADLSQNIAYITDFEEKAKPILTNMKVEKQADLDEAMRMLEDLSKNQNLLLPDYRSFTPSANVVTGGEMEKVKAKYNM